jgi:proteasome lid subunit RPN8/RPN11
MIVPHEVWAGVLSHCYVEAKHRREACGILAGPQGPPGRTVTVDAGHRMANVHDRPHARFAFDDDEQIKLWMTLDEAGRRPWVIYHCHLDTPSVMSAEDLLHGTGDLSMRHLVVSLSDRDARLWRVGAIRGVIVARPLRLKVVDQQGNQHSVEW